LVRHIYLESNLVFIRYKNGVLKKVLMNKRGLDKSLSKELKKPKTPAEEVEFIRKIVRIYKKDL